MQGRRRPRRAQTKGERPPASPRRSPWTADRQDWRRRATRGARPKEKGSLGGSPRRMRPAAKRGRALHRRPEGAAQGAARACRLLSPRSRQCARWTEGVRPGVPDLAPSSPLSSSHRRLQRRERATLTPPAPAPPRPPCGWSDRTCHLRQCGLARGVRVAWGELARGAMLRLTRGGPSSPSFSLSLCSVGAPALLTKLLEPTPVQPCGAP